MWHFLLMMLAPPNAGMRLAMSQSSTTLASHAFSVPSFALAFAISFWPCCFPCSERHPAIRRYDADPWQHCSLKPSQMQPASVGACAFLCLGASTLCKLQSRGQALTDDGGTVAQKLLVWCGYFRLAELEVWTSGKLPLHVTFRASDGSLHPIRWTIQFIDMNSQNGIFFPTTE